MANFKLIENMFGDQGLGKAVEKAFETFPEILQTFLPSLIERKGKAKAKCIDYTSQAEAKAMLTKVHAEEKAKMIRAVARVDRADLAMRAKIRKSQLEIQRQQNIESILLLSMIDLLNDEDVSDDLVDVDWRSRFLDNCQDVSNEQMQTLWARLLAGEIAQPRSFSLHTLEIVKNMTQMDARDFTRLCSFVWQIDGNCEIVTTGDPYSLLEEPIDSDVCFQLDSLGLIHFEQRDGFKHDITIDTTAVYFDKKIKITPTRKNQLLFLGSVKLAKPGTELIPLAGAKPDYVYFDTVIKQWSLSKIEHLD